MINGGIMKSPTEFQNNDDLAFFGRVNASISHELKNILAIISETAGLLNDLTRMASEGKEVELETLSIYSEDIVEEIQRGFMTVNQMNRFAHSLDDPFKKVDLIEILNLMIHLAGFLSFAVKVRFKKPEGDAPNIFTCPFRLQNLIYQTLLFAFKSAGPLSEIDVSVHEKNGNVRITFAGLGPGTARTFLNDKTKRVADSIKAEILVNQDYQALDILIPEDINRA
jgi:signal transduction histidine kinase